MFKNVTNQFNFTDEENRKEALAHIISIMFGVDLDRWQVDACIDMVKGRSVIGRQFKRHNEYNIDNMNIIERNINW